MDPGVLGTGYMLLLVMTYYSRVVDFKIPMSEVRSFCFGQLLERLIKFLKVHQQDCQIDLKCAL